MITKLDNTRFEIDLLTLYRNTLKSFILTKLMNYNPSDYNQTKEHQFDVLFLTPSNMASDFFKTDFFISSMIVDGIQMKEKNDVLGTEYSDVTSVDDQIHFTFEEELVQ